jgi:transposase
MIQPQFTGKVYLASGATDMRKAINGLSMLVEQAMDLDPFSGDLFVFCNRKRLSPLLALLENEIRQRTADQHR